MTAAAFRLLRRFYANYIILSGPPEAQKAAPRGKKNTEIEMQRSVHTSQYLVLIVQAPH